MKIEKNLSEITWRDIALRATPEDLQKIVFAEAPETLEQKCEVGIVFGGPVDMMPYRLDEAVKLYHNGHLERLLVTGGIGFLNPDRKTPEALKMQKYLLEHDIPDYAIITEDASRNTLENILNSLRLLEQDYDDIDAIRLALITSDFHVRRCRGMMALHTNHDYIYGVGARDGITDIENWPQTRKGIYMITKEALALTRYAQQGRMDDVPISGLALKRTLIKTK